MSNKRDYPLFLIDRSSPEAYPFDYVICTDPEMAFIARIEIISGPAQYAEFCNRAKESPGAETIQFHQPYKSGGVQLEIIEFFYTFEWSDDTRARIKVLLKKALKKYIHTEMKTIYNQK